MAYINPRHAVPSLDVQIALANGKKASAKLSVMPLYDPGDTRTKAFA
jgi:aminomethyltransferase